MHPIRSLVALGGKGRVPEVPDRSQATLRRLARFTARVLGAPIAYVVIDGGDGRTASTGLGEIAARRSIEAFAARIADPASETDAPAQEMLENGLSALGAPLRTSSGTTSGALCVADAASRAWTADEIELIQELAALVAVEMELRATSRMVGVLADRGEEQRQLLEAIVAASPLSIVTVSDDGTVLNWNPAAERIFGWAADEVVGRQAPNIPPELQMECRMIRERTRRGETITGMRTLRRRKDGATLTVSLSTAPLRTAAGDIAGVIAISIDITERVAAEEALRASEARKGAILEASLDCIVTMDHTGAIVDFNPAAERTFGYRRADAIGKTVADLIVPPQHRATHRIGLNRYLQTGESTMLGRRTEMQAMRADGSEFPAELTLTRADTPGPPLFTAFIRDLSEKRTAEDALRRSEELLRNAQKLEAIGRVAGSIAHDFNNVLEVIHGYAELLTMAPGGTAQEEAAEILRASTRAAALVRQLLAFSRGEQLDPTEVDVNAVVQELEPMLRRLVGDRIELVTTLAPEVESLLADRSKLEQVIVNLVVNARDATPPGGRIEISTGMLRLDRLDRPDPALLGLSGKIVSIEVADTGSGMDADTRARVFEPFFTTKQEGQGTGLGLATVYGVVTQSGGRVTVQSAPGEGSTFRIHLPVSSSAAPTPTPVLTPRQHEVLRLLAEGLGTRAIAERLVCAETTARNHVNAVIHRLGCHSRLEAVLRGQQLGLV